MAGMEPKMMMNQTSVLRPLSVWTASYRTNNGEETNSTKINRFTVSSVVSVSIARSESVANRSCYTKCRKYA